MTGEAIHFDRVTKIFGDQQVALADISFSVPRGAKVGLLGANGSGKSTLLRITLGLITPSGGEVSVLGERMTPGQKRLRQRVGFLSDSPTFPPDFTAIGYLSFVGNCFGLERKEHRARVANLLRAVGLTEDAGRKIGTYSTGMRTRLGIAASLMNDPELLVWDEPTAGLDPISRRQTLDLLEQFRGNKTIVLSSHILGDVDRVCDRLLILNQGQLLFQGSRTELEDLLPKSLLELRVAGDVVKFRTLIWEKMQRKDFSQDGDKIRLELGQSEVAGEMIETLLQLAKEAAATVVSINSTARQLEDAYLKLVTEDEFRGFLRAKDP